jgi:hypothetical protein
MIKDIAKERFPHKLLGGTHKLLGDKEAEQWVEKDKMYLDNSEAQNAFVDGADWLRENIEPIYKKWLRQTERSGSVITGKSMKEFFDYLKTVKL